MISYLGLIHDKTWSYLLTNNAYEDDLICVYFRNKI